MKTRLAAILLFLPAACHSAEEAPEGAAVSPVSATARPETEPTTPPDTETVRDSALIFTPQPGWQVETPANDMRVAQYSLPAPDGGTAAPLVVFHFGGGGGSLQANIDRWCDQFEQPDGTPSADRVQLSEITVAGMRVTLVDLSGRFRAETAPGSGTRVDEPGSRMLAAVIESDHGPYYAKLWGPTGTVTHWEPAFLRFVNDCRPEPAGR